MKILTVGEFDPCGVHLRHREYLRSLGVDYRLAVHDVYRDEGLGADYIASDARCRYDELEEFARAADIIQFLPGIGQPWSFQNEAARLDGDADEVPFGRIDWRRQEFRRARRVAVMHGSKTLAANASAYAAHYRAKGMAVIATTLDYVHWMGARYLRPIVDVRGRAPIRMPGDRLLMIHSPTDMSACSSREFMERVRMLHVRTTLATGIDYRDVVKLKTQHHAGFDHLRGSFSINSLENAALGMVNLVGVRSEFRAFLEGYGIRLPWPPVETMADVVKEIQRLQHDADATADLQKSAHRWFWDQWEPRRVAHDVLALYRSL